MVDTAFDRAERGLGSTDLSVADIVAKTRGNPNEIMKLVMAGQINLTQGLLAKRLSDSVVAEQQKAAAPTTTVLQDSFPQLAPAMGGLQPPAAPMAPAAPQGMGPVAPQMQAPQGMVEGGLAQLDFAAPDYAGGGIVAFAAGDPVPAPEEEDEEEMLYGLPASYFEAPTLDLAGARQEVTGLLPQTNTALEAFRARLGEEEDPAKARERAELGALFQSIGNVRPGMNPLEALAQGFATSGASMQAAEERGREQELQRLEGLMNLENAQNQRERDLYNISIQLAEARRSGADAAVVRRLEAAQAHIEREYKAAEAEKDRRFEARENALDRGSRLQEARIGASGGGGGGGGGPTTRPLTPSAASQLLSPARTAMNEALANVTRLANNGEYAAAEAARREYETARQTYNAAAAAIPDVPQANRRSLTTINIIPSRLQGYTEFLNRRRENLVQGRQNTVQRRSSSSGGSNRPAGVSAAEWNAMTPEERELF